MVEMVLTTAIGRWEVCREAGDAAPQPPPRPTAPERQLAQCRQNVAVKVTSVCGRRTRLAVHLDVHAHKVLGEIGDGRLRRGRGRHRIFAALDAVDDDGGLLPRLVGGEFAVVPESHPLQPGGALSTAPRRACGRSRGPRTPKPAKSRSQNRVSLVSTVRASTVRLVIRSSLRFGMATLRASFFEPEGEDNPSSNRKRPASIRRAFKRNSDRYARVGGRWEREKRAYLQQVIIPMC